jgi:predicted enzyme related to lactoylglutathione lyase
VRSDLGYYTIPVADLQRGKAFYGAVLGWTFEDDGGHAADSNPPGGRGAGGGNGIRVYFRTDDIRAAVARVRDAGGEAAAPVLYKSGWSADCRDDQGTRFSLWEPAEAYR